MKPILMAEAKRPQQKPRLRTEPKEMMVTRPLEETEQTSRFIDKKEAARMLSCSVRLIDYLRKDGLPLIRLGSKVIFDPKDILRWCRQRKTVNATE